MIHGSSRFRVMDSVMHQVQSFLDDYNFTRKLVSFFMTNQPIHLKHSLFAGTGAKLSLN